MQRVIIREAVPADAEQIVAYMQRISHEPNNNILTGPGEFTLSVEEERQIIEEYAAAGNAVSLVADAGGQIIGLLHCRGGKRRAVRHTASLGITVHQDWRNKGVGSALMARLVEWARQNPVITRLELEVFTDNPRAIHVYEKLGFQIEGCKRRAVYKDGQYHDIYVMALLLES
jgi:RimJ/RimL family protein N-acetyltransferase